MNALEVLKGQGLKVELQANRLFLSPPALVTPAVLRLARERRSELIAALGGPPFTVLEAARRLARRLDECGEPLADYLANLERADLDVEDWTFAAELKRRIARNTEIAAALASDDPAGALLDICRGEGIALSVSDGADGIEVEGKISIALLRAISQHAAAIAARLSGEVLPS